MNFCQKLFFSHVFFDHFWSIMTIFQKSNVSVNYCNSSKVDFFKVDFFIKVDFFSKVFFNHFRSKIAIFQKSNVSINKCYLLKVVFFVKMDFFVKSVFFQKWIFFKSGFLSKVFFDHFWSKMTIFQKSKLLVNYCNLSKVVFFVESGFLCKKCTFSKVFFDHFWSKMAIFQKSNVEQSVNYCNLLY